MLCGNETLDIHGGGEDLRQTHHPNEIAQSEAVTGKLFVRHWVHGAFILVDGKRMGKSLGNAYLVDDLEKRGFDPLVLRYLYLTGNYREIFNFTWESLTAAQNALNNLRETIRNWDQPVVGCAEHEQRFTEALDNDLNTAQALAILWELVKSDYPTSAKAGSLLKMDQVLGLGLAEFVAKKIDVPENVMELVSQREEARKNSDYHKSDQLRKQIK
ncbi:MAG: Cysteine-tRNA ligase, partial [Candidatus Daviesbacteria bacterium GW2011_GWA2_42_7]